MCSESVDERWEPRELRSKGPAAELAWSAVEYQGLDFFRSWGNGLFVVDLGSDLAAGNDSVEGFYTKFRSILPMSGIRK